MPELTPIEESGERDFLFNHFDKTGIFGEFWTRGRWNETTNNFDGIFDDNGLSFTNGEHCVMINENGNLGNDFLFSIIVMI